MRACRSRLLYAAVAVTVHLFSPRFSLQDDVGHTGNAFQGLEHFSFLPPTHSSIDCIPDAQ